MAEIIINHIVPNSYELFIDSKISMVKSMAQSLGRRSYSIEEKAFAVSREDKVAAENKSAYMGMLLKWRELDMAIMAVQNYPPSPDEATEMRFGDVLRRQHAVKGNDKYCRQDQQAHGQAAMLFAPVYRVG